MPAKFVLPSAFEADAESPRQGAEPAEAAEPARDQSTAKIDEGTTGSPLPVEPRQDQPVERSVAVATPTWSDSSPAPRAERSVARAQSAPAPYVLPADSGLEMVETQHTLVPQPAVEEVEAPRARRVRPPRAVAQDEPLEFVETRKDSPPAP